MNASADLTPSARHLAGRYRRASLSAPTIALSIAVVDVAALMLAAWFALFAAAPAFEGGVGTGWAATLASLAAGGIALGGGYARRRTRRGWSSAGLMLVAMAGAAALIGFARPMGASPERLIAVAVLATALGPVPLRVILAGLVRWAADMGLMERRAVLVGGGDGARRVIDALEARPDNDVRVCAIFDDRSGARSPDLVLDVPRIGQFADLVGFARAAEIDLVVITIDPSAQARIGQLVETFSVLPIPIHLSAFSDDMSFGSGGGGGLLALAEGTLTPGTRLAKRAFDLSVGLAALAALSPVMLLAAIAIRLETSGPVLFRQWRSGFSERPVEVLKFRTMREETLDPRADRVVTRDDDRVTRVGRFLRRTSIDELPQLVNVIRGDLSLVGPRPHAIDARSAAQERFDALVVGYSRRHRLPPGLTGWAQIHGLRGTVEAADAIRARVDHDLWYIENWSLGLDLKILLRTPLSLLRGENAF